MKTYGAEFFGTFWLVLGGCGSAVLAAAFPDVASGCSASRWHSG
jgi:aquaporin Z